MVRLIENLIIKKDSIIRDQVGFEIIGSRDEKNDDKEIINTALNLYQT